MAKQSPIRNDYTFIRIPLSARSSFFTVTLIRIGLITALSQFMLGATLGHAMTFGQAMLATCLGSLILEFVGLGLGIAGAREGLPTSLLSRWCGFGRFGSVLIGLSVAVSSLGWFGVQNGVVAKSLEYASGGKLSFGYSAVISGMVITVLVAFGFRALGWTAKVSVPLFTLIIGWISFNLLTGNNISDFIDPEPARVTMTLSAGATMVAGGYITAALLTPDISRYCKNSKHVFWMITLSIIVGEFIVNGIAILIAHALHTDDVVTIMTQTAGWIGLLSVILAAVKVNDVNLYSVSLGFSNAIEGLTEKKWRYTWLTLTAGTLGTMLTVMGILDNFINFLSLTGVIFPPIAGVMLVDYYILRTSRALLDTTRVEQTLPDNVSTPLIGWSAMAAWIAGSVVGLTVQFGIPSFNSIVVAGIIHLVLSVFSKKLTEN